MRTDVIDIVEAAELSGVLVRTLRNYFIKGVVECRKTAGGTWLTTRKQALKLLTGPSPVRIGRPPLKERT